MNTLLYPVRLMGQHVREELNTFQFKQGAGSQTAHISMLETNPTRGS